MVPKHLHVYIALIALLGGCTGGAPSEADARQEFEKRSGWADQIRDGAVKILSFKKVDGQTGEFMGTNTYTMYYEAQLEYLKNLPPLNHYYCAKLMGEEGRDCSVMKAGDKVTVKGKIGFGKTERGWQGKSGTVY